MTKSTKIYSALIINKKTGQEILSLGFYKTKECLRKYVNETLIKLKEIPENVEIEIVTDHLISS